MTGESCLSYVCPLGTVQVGPTLKQGSAEGGAAYLEAVGGLLEMQGAQGARLREGLVEDVGSDFGVECWRAVETLDALLEKGLESLLEEYEDSLARSSRAPTKKELRRLHTPALKYQKQPTDSPPDTDTDTNTNAATDNDTSTAPSTPRGAPGDAARDGDRKGKGQFQGPGSASASSASVSRSPSLSGGRPEAWVAMDEASLRLREIGTVLFRAGRADQCLRRYR